MREEFWEFNPFLGTTAKADIFDWAKKIVNGFKRSFKKYIHFEKL